MSSVKVVVVVALLGGISVFSFGSCGGGASGFCETFCPAFVSCSAEPERATRVPLFCDADLATMCEPLCEDTADGLGDSKAAFLDCGGCVLDYGAKDACDKGKSEDTGKVSCADTCQKPKAGDGASKFYDDFTEAFTLKVKDTTCTQTGEKAWVADDPAVQHSGGEEGGGGSWSCTEYCGYLMYGPYAWLPAGSYAAGFTGVSTGTPNAGNEATVDVTSDGGSTSIVKKTFKSSQLSGRLSVSFTLSKPTENVEVRLYYDSAVKVGGVFIARE